MRTVTALLNGSNAKPRARRTQRGASAIHSEIAVSDLAPARTLAAAVARIRQAREEGGEAHRVGQRLRWQGTGQLLQARRHRRR
ncbi:hypothetical protein [Streptomyces sp. NPDC048560]|uniref:hypothetical protein n=1 Tax=Streptomyces sp. NPDC048560 TaxID=3155488 RepID=UPI00341E3078